jgi:hypothetical protein
MLCHRADSLEEAAQRKHEDAADRKPVEELRPDENVRRRYQRITATSELAFFHDTSQYRVLVVYGFSL